MRHPPIMTPFDPARRLHASGRLIPAPLDEKMVRAVVDRFYNLARADDVIGPVFNRVIPDADWPTHLDKITDFWSAMLLGTGRYNGRPMPAHLRIPDLSDVHFARWLKLFRHVVEDICPIEVAAVFLDRAERIGHNFRTRIHWMRTGVEPQLDVLRAEPTPWQPD